MSFQKHRVIARLTLLSLLIFYGLSLSTVAKTFVTPSSGLIFFDSFNPEPAVGAVPVTHAARAQAQGLGPLLRVLEVNGVAPEAIPGTQALPVRLREATVLRATNTFLVEDHAGHQRRLSLPREPPEFGALPPMLYFGLAYQIVGLLYFFVGLLVWVRRPTEPTAYWLLLLGAVAAIHLCQSVPDTGLGRALSFFGASMLPLHAPIALGLVRAFTGYDLSPWARRVQWIVRALAPLLALGMPLGFSYWLNYRGSGLPFKAVILVTGLQVLAAVAVFLWSCYRGMQPDNPPLTRRRSKVLAIAAAVSFGLPAFQLLWVPFADQPPIEWMVPNLIFLSVFPATMGYAILRYQLFDLRIVLRRGAIYAVLSLAASVGFFAIVVLIADVIGARAQSPTSLWALSFGMVISVGVAQLYLQSAVDRWVYRKRNLYAKAVALASEDLVRAHTLKAANDIARRAFIDTMGLCRAYVAFVQEGNVSCVVLENGEDPASGQAPEPPPELSVLEEMGPLGTALRKGQMITAYDVHELPSMPGAQPLAAEFWTKYGLEVVVPMFRRGDPADAMGFLLLGPRRDARPLDSDDHRLVHQLANQLTVAMENALAFEQIKALKEGLEDRVKVRTRDLQRAIEDLKSAEATLVESEKQAMLGRLVAGIVHEVNTPLGALTSSADTLQRVLVKLETEIPQDASPRVRKRLKTAAELVALQSAGGARIGALINSLKTFVSLDAAELQDVDVREGIDSTLKVLSADISKAALEVTRDYPDRPAKVRAHAQRLNQVFLHVLQNAIKAAPGTGQISISIEDTEPGHIVVRVHDNGPGISNEVQAGMFDFGFSVKGGRMGLRLGLPSSQRTVREMGGEITVDSGPERGTTIVIDLPTVVRH